MRHAVAVVKKKSSSHLRYVVTGIPTSRFGDLLQRNPRALPRESDHSAPWQPYEVDIATAFRRDIQEVALAKLYGGDVAEWPRAFPVDLSGVVTFRVVLPLESNAP